jgi:hypothetical protein
MFSSYETKALLEIIFLKMLSCALFKSTIEARIINLARAFSTGLCTATGELRNSLAQHKTLHIGALSFLDLPLRFYSFLEVSRLIKGFICDFEVQGL